MSSVVLVAFMGEIFAEGHRLWRTAAQVAIAPADKASEIPIHPPSCTPPTMSMSVTSSSSAGAIGLSGMRAAQLRMDSHAHNVANVQTPDFRRQVTTQAARADSGGVDTQTGREAQVSAPFDRLADDLVGQRMSLYSFAANLRTVQTQDRMLGTLLDTKA